MIPSVNTDSAGTPGPDAGATPGPGSGGPVSGTRGLPVAVRVSLLLLVVVVFTAGGLAWFGQAIVLEKFSETELQLVRQNRTILNQAIVSEEQHLQAIVTDWGQWDDLYDFVEGRNPAFEPTELGDRVLDRLDMDVLLIVDPDGRLHYGEVRSDAGHPGTDDRVAQAALLASLLDGGDDKSVLARSTGRSVLPPAGSQETSAGLMNTARGPLVLALRPISRTDGSGDPAGTLVMARYLHPESLFAKLSVLPSTVFLHRSGSADDDSRLVTRRDDMSDFRLFRDLRGRPAFMLETRMPRSIVATGRETVRLLLLGLIVAGAIALLILGALIHGIISAPLQRLTRHMLALRECAEPRPTPGAGRKDELGTLARRFQELLMARSMDQVRLERLAAAVEHAGDAVAILDADGRITYVNPRYESQSGFKRDEVIGTVPSRGASAGTTYQELWATVRAGRTWSGTLQTNAPDGAIRWEEVTVSPIKDANGQITSFVAVMRDITARRATDAELRNLSAVVEYTAESIAVLNADGRIQYVNPAYERKRGLSSSDLVGQVPGGAIRGRDDPALYKSMRHTAASGRTWTGRITSEAADGSLLTEDAVVSPVFTEGQAPSSYVIILHDVSRRIHLEAQLAQAQKLEAVGQLAAGVAHEINTPTQYVGGNIRFLRDAFTSVTVLLGELAELTRTADAGTVSAAALARALTAADVDYLRAEVPVAIRQSLEGVERVGEIVKSMRELAHPARDFALTDLNRVVESAVRVAGNEWHGIAELSTELDPALPPVPCLAGAMNQVIVNLLVNAAHAIEGGSRSRDSRQGRITVVTRQAGEYVEIRITDNGVGMSDEVRKRIFDPFFTTKHVGQGTGQGLAIAHSVVKKHNGSISVESEPGCGTCFTIRLPRAVVVAGGDVAAA